MRSRASGFFHDDDEHGVAALDKVAHQGALGLEIEDVVFHDPGGDDEDRLRKHLAGRRLVLDQFDQVIAVDDLAWRDRHVSSDLERLRTRGRLAGEHAVEVVQPVGRAANQVEAGLLHRFVEDQGVQPRGVARRIDIKERPHHEGDFGLGVTLEARDVACGLAPPGLRRKLALDQDVEWPMRP